MASIELTIKKIEILIKRPLTKEEKLIVGVAYGDGYGKAIKDRRGET